MTQGKKPFENILGKTENAGNLHFSLFPEICLNPIKAKIAPINPLLHRY